MECDDMSIDVTFEELEKTAFEFAKSLAVGNVKTSFSLKAMQLATTWHEEKELRKAWYVCNSLQESDWQKIDIDSDYDGSDFKEGIDYWVIRADGKPFKVNLVRFESIRGRDQPIFCHPGNPYENFTVDQFLPQSISDQLTNGINPNHPTQSKTRARPISASLKMP